MNTTIPFHQPATPRSWSHTVEVSETKLTKAKAQILQKTPFFACMSADMKFDVSLQTDDFACDGETFHYNPLWMAEQTVATVRAAICKATIHRGLSHHLRRGERDAKLWNACCTWATVPMLIEYGMTDLPEQVFNVPPELDKAKTAEHMYKIMQDLIQEQQPQPGQGEGDGGQGNGEQQPSNEPGDQVSSSGQPDNAPENDANPAGEEGNDPSEGKQDQDQTDQTGTDTPSKVPDMPGQVWDGKATKQGAEQDINEAERENAERVLQAAQMEEAGRKQQGLGTSKTVQEIAESKVALNTDWEDEMFDILQDMFCVDEMDYSRRNRRLSINEVIVPGHAREPTGEIVFGIDVSSSLNNRELEVIKGNIMAVVELINPTKYYIIYCTSRVTKVQEYERGDEPEVKRYGKGGTLFHPVFNRVTQMEIEPDVLIYFTDGGGHIDEGQLTEGEPDYPVIWATTDDEPTYYSKDDQFRTTFEDLGGVFGTVLHIEL